MFSQDLALTSLEAPSIEAFRKSSGKSKEFLLRASHSQSAVLRVASGTVQLVKILDGVRETPVEHFI